VPGGGRDCSRELDLFVFLRTDEILSICPVFPEMDKCLNSVRQGGQ